MRKAAATATAVPIARTGGRYQNAALTPSSAITVVEVTTAIPAFQVKTPCTSVSGASTASSAGSPVAPRPSWAVRMSRRTRVNA